MPRISGAFSFYTQKKSHHETSVMAKFKRVFVEPVRGFLTLFAIFYFTNSVLTLFLDVLHFLSKNSNSWSLLFTLYTAVYCGLVSRSTRTCPVRFSLKSFRFIVFTNQRDSYYRPFFSLPFAIFFYGDTAENSAT